MNKGKFVFSLDFELFWGVHHNKSYESYKANLEAAIINLPKFSKIFIEYNAHFTCASVGMLYNSNINEWYKNKPLCLPNYRNKSLNPYHKIGDIIGKVNSRHLFATKTLRDLANDGHEMATHTYSHYFSLESGADINDFEDDLKMALKIGLEYGHKFESIVFPRNQFSEEYLKICLKHGISVFRGNPENGLFSKSNNILLSKLKRIIRMFDSFINITGSNAFIPQKNNLEIQNIQASFFYRSASSFKVKFIMKLHIRRIKRAMSHAAKKGLVFHLWCHPHNLSTNIDLENFNDILKHFNVLKEKYGFESCRMKDFKY